MEGVMRLVLFASALLLTAGVADAKQNKSDAEWRRELIGKWIVPPDSADATPENVKGFEDFLGDGTYVAYQYSDHLCGKVAQMEQVSWDVTNGVLTSVESNGRVMRDELLASRSES
jgi:hypothetical protein